MPLPLSDLEQLTAYMNGNPEACRTARLAWKGSHQVIMTRYKAAKKQQQIRVKKEENADDGENPEKQTPEGWLLVGQTTKENSLAPTVGKQAPKLAGLAIPCAKHGLVPCQGSFCTAELYGQLRAEVSPGCVCFYCSDHGGGLGKNMVPCNGGYCGKELGVMKIRVVPGTICSFYTGRKEGEATNPTFSSKATIAADEAKKQPQIYIALFGGQQQKKPGGGVRVKVEQNNGQPNTPPWTNTPGHEFPQQGLSRRWGTDLVDGTNHY